MNLHAIQDDLVAYLRSHTLGGGQTMDWQRHEDGVRLQFRMRNTVEWLTLTPTDTQWYERAMREEIRLQIT